MRSSSFRSFGPYCGIITSYEPNHNAISREPANSDERYKFDTYTQHVLVKYGQTTKQYEDEAKRRFIEEPANLKLSPGTHRVILIREGFKPANQEVSIEKGKEERWVPSPATSLELGE